MNTFILLRHHSLSLTKFICYATEKIADYITNKNATTDIYPNIFLTSANFTLYISLGHHRPPQFSPVSPANHVDTTTPQSATEASRTAPALNLSSDPRDLKKTLLQARR